MGPGILLQLDSIFGVLQWTNYISYSDAIYNTEEKQATKGNLVRNPHTINRNAVIWLVLVYNNRQSPQMPGIFCPPATSN